MDGLSFNTPFEDMKVNAYLVWDPDSKKAVAFDTGADCDPMLEAIDAHGLALNSSCSLMLTVITSSSSIVSERELAPPGSGA